MSKLISSRTREKNSRIVESAINATTVAHATQVQQLIRESIGEECWRPLGDLWANHGIMASSGSSYDLKLMEPVTNGQDSVLERLALLKYGDPSKVPYLTPHDAAADLLKSRPSSEVADDVRVTFEESDTPAKRTKRLTVIFRDRGCGMCPVDVPRTIFRLGGSHKENALYMQGAFGLGGAMAYRNAGAVVLVSRRDPALLADDQEDVITVAVVEWRDMTKGSTAAYLVDRPWGQPGDFALPWSCPASDFPDFEVGTHLALVSYGVEGFHRQTERDDRTFYAVANTRLFKPVMPIKWTNNTARGRNTTIAGLAARMAATGIDLVREDDVIPLNVGGTTYHLPMSMVLFKAAPKESGGREALVAHGHAVLFTSNGQVHHHWSPEELRQRTGFNRVHNRVLAVVETDELPILLRTSLFTADRSALRRGDAAVKLEDTVSSALKESETLREWNGELQRDALKASSMKGTASVARQIGEVMRAKGFGFGGDGGSAGGVGSGAGGSGGNGRGRRKEIKCQPDPTYVKCSSNYTLVRGETRTISIEVDAVDSFYDGRGELAVTTDHPDLGEKEITVGRGRKGRVKVMVAVPDEAELGDFTLTARLKDWMRAGGGLGPELVCVSTLSVVDEIEGKGAGSGKRGTGKGKEGPSSGSSIALVWSSPDEHESWSKMTVGEVEMTPASILAQVEEYKDLADLGDVEIPTLTLNQEYPRLKRYLESRSKHLSDLSRPKEQYALGVGVALLTLHEESAKGGKLAPETLGAMTEAAARGVLAVMPAFDALIREIGADPG